MNKFKELLEKAGDLQFIKKAKDYIALHKIAAVTTATTAAAEKGGMPSASSWMPARHLAKSS